MTLNVRVGNYGDNLICGVLCSLVDEAVFSQARSVPTYGQAQ